VNQCKLSPNRFSENFRTASISYLGNGGKYRIDQIALEWKNTQAKFATEEFRNLAIELCPLRVGPEEFSWYRFRLPPFQGDSAIP